MNNSSAVSIMGRPYNNHMILLGLFVLSMIWAFTNSDFVMRLTAENYTTVYQFVRFALLIAMFGALVLCSSNSKSAAYLFGASPALGMIPEIPYLPFFIEFSHLAVFCLAAAIYFENQGLSLQKAMAPKLTKIYLLFLLVALFSIFMNYAVDGSIWQLKVGISNYILLAGFFLLLLLLGSSSSVDETKILKGFADAAFIISVIGVFFFLILLVTPYSQGIGGYGLGVLYGFGFYDRLQLMFKGPVTMGVYFVMAIPVIVSLLQEQGKDRSSKMWFTLQAIPWLVAASGSRTAKIALVAVILLNLMHKKNRSIILWIVPSSIVVLFVTWQYQSSQAAISDILEVFGYSWQKIQSMLPYLPSPNFKVGYFHDEDRIHLIRYTVNFVISSDYWRMIFGNGYGIGGFNATKYPAPHSELFNMIVEVGFLGLIVSLVFMFEVARQLTRGMRVHGLRDKMFTLSILVLCLGLYSLTYTVKNQGVVWMPIVILFAYSNKMHWYKE